MEKIPVNKNFIWAEAFINQLCDMGVRYACISPGSRSTPLVSTLANNKKVKCFVHIDERVSGFFALGIAKATGVPVIIVTTSGTATSEIYPSIIEAFQQRVPLIICTADRPPELWKTGSNQTINQWDLYKNHIRWFKNVGLPDLSSNRIAAVKKIALKAFEISNNQKTGPVHLNFPFRKPLDKNSHTDEVDIEMVDELTKPILIENAENELTDFTKRETRQVENVCSNLNEHSNGLIIVGPMNYDENFLRNVKVLSNITRYPILADGVSNLRFGSSDTDQTVCSNYDAFLRSDDFRENHKPEIIIQFGRTVTSVTLQNYVYETKPRHYVINKFGDPVYPSVSGRTILKFEPTQFCEKLIERLKERNPKRKRNSWRKDFETAEEIIESFKKKQIKNSEIKIEPTIITTALASIPSNSNIMIGNSLPIRDFDWFAGKSAKSFHVYFNRGASGIDGVTSTALGIASIKKPTVLITGDLSFIHDLNALLPAGKYSIQMLVILINNNGGGIFNMLPGASKKKSFTEYFIAPHNLNISSIVKSFGLIHHQIKSNEDLKTKIKSALRSKTFTVLEIKTDGEKSTNFRKSFWIKNSLLNDHHFRFVKN
jgi:2-succinyl-5-enolpyruvyl-6-hydroxy-3-cyclohexene-1-carboxylate synthase